MSVSQSKQSNLVSERENGSLSAPSSSSPSPSQLSSYLSNDLLTIKMKLRTSTVMQRAYGRTELIVPKTICDSITCHSLILSASSSSSLGDERMTSNSSSSSSSSPSKVMDSEKFENNNNNSEEFIDNYEEHFVIDNQFMDTPSRSKHHETTIAHEDDSKRKSIKKEFICTGDDPIVYVGQAKTKRRRLVESDIHSTTTTTTTTTESHQSSTSLFTVPDSTTCNSCNNNNTKYAKKTMATSELTAAHLQQQQQQRQKKNSQSRSPLSFELSPPKSRYLGQPRKLMSLGALNGSGYNADKHMPWFGIDIGGTLIKVVFFDPKDASRDELVTLKRIRRYLKSSKAYGTTGKRDTHLEMTNCVMNKREGSLHFIRFATSQMPDFLALAKDKKLAETIDRVCATGGGAYKFENEIKTSLGITLNKTDELDSIIYGIHYIDKYNSDRECYFLEDPLDDAKCVKVPYDFSQPYPYLVVNIGSGVSILAVYSSTSYSRISGSSIGGGTFLGLCSLLTQCETFDEAIELAEAGSSVRIDKRVKDIYGGDYNKFNLSGDTVASNFGHMNLKEKHKEVSRADLARALLEMVTINIGCIARNCAAKEEIDRVVFIGNFLRVNQLSMKLLSYAVNYWSKGAIKALFLEHEGYFGAVGCFVESTRGH